MNEKTCEVRCFGPVYPHKLDELEWIEYDSKKIDDEDERFRPRVGCFKPARFENPFYSPSGGGPYNYARWLCAEHYDEAIEMKNEPWWDCGYDPWAEDESEKPSDE